MNFAARLGQIITWERYPEPSVIGGEIRGMPEKVKQSD
jgi:hypothetical protein